MSRTFEEFTNLENNALDQQLVKLIKNNNGEQQQVKQIIHSDAQSTITKVSTNYSCNDESETSIKLKSRENIGSEEELSCYEQDINSNNALTLESIIQNANAGIPTVAEEKLKQKRVLQLKQKNIKLKQKLANQIKAKTREYQNNEQLCVKQELVSKQPVLQKMQARVTSASFVNRQHTKKWTEEETKKFYKGLEIFGTDFSLISKLFPTRNRIQVKNKFRKEEKDDIEKVDDFLRRNRQMRQKKISQIIQDKKEQHNYQKLDINDRIKLLVDNNRNHRLMSCSSIDTMDIIVNEEIIELQKISQINNKNQIPINN